MSLQLGLYRPPASTPTAVYSGAPASAPSGAGLAVAEPGAAPAGAAGFASIMKDTIDALVTPPAPGTPAPATAQAAPGTAAPGMPALAMAQPAPGMPALAMAQPAPGTAAPATAQVAPGTAVPVTVQAAPGTTAPPAPDAVPAQDAALPAAAPQAGISGPARETPAEPEQRETGDPAVVLAGPTYPPLVPVVPLAGTTAPPAPVAPPAEPGHAAVPILGSIVAGPATALPGEPTRTTSSTSAPADGQPAAASAAPASIQPATGVPLPVVATGIPSAPLAAAPASASAPPAMVPLTAQIAGPLFTLTGVKPGEHVITINVAPDNLGPVTVRAHVTPEGVRMELFAPTDLAREALRAILPELRRDLAGSSMNAQLDLSDQNQTADPQTARQPRSQPDGPRPEARGGNADASIPAYSVPTPRFGAFQTIDVMA